MVQLETVEDIVNVGKALKEELQTRFGFHITSGSALGYSKTGGFSIKKNEIVFEFPCGRLIEKGSSPRNNKYECEVYDAATDQVLMTREEFMSVFRQYFGNIEHEDFALTFTWGVRVPLKATKAAGEIWHTDSTTAPEKLFVLYRTKSTILVAKSLSGLNSTRINLSEVIGKTYFWTREEAYQCYKKNLSAELACLQEQKKAIFSRIYEIEQIQAKLH